MICIPKLALEIQDLSLPATVLSTRLDDSYSNIKTNFGTEQGDFLGQDKSIFGLNKMNYRTYQCDFLGHEKLILGHNKMNYRT
jgi:hypothetical protein